MEVSAKTSCLCFETCILNFTFFFNLLSVGQSSITIILESVSIAIGYLETFKVNLNHSLIAVCIRPFSFI